jgi:hypothetical protein
VSIGLQRRAQNRSRTAALAPAERELPGWPVLILLWGMPAWWALGMLPFIAMIVAVPMIAFLSQRSRVKLVPGMLPFVAFVVWMLPCALMLDSFGRMIGFSMRFAHFAAVAVALVYVINARHALTVRRVMSGLTFTWVFVIAGGYLGMLWPETTLTMTIGQLLPASILENEYVRDLVFPSFAEVQTPWGAEQPFERPSAPFPYTNGWGAAIAILTPIAVATALERRTAAATVWLMLGIAAAIPPAIATTNRGLFVGLIAAVCYVLFRLLARGKWVPFIWVGSLGAILVVLLTLTGALNGIAERQDAADTSEGRGALYEETFVRALASPIFGYGAPRPSFTSEITVGTQGMIWDAMFCFGFVGLALFAFFLLGGLARTWSAPNVSALWLHSSIVSACALSIFYGLDRHILTICLVLGVMLRERYAPSSRYWNANPRTEISTHAA